MHRFNEGNKKAQEEEISNVYSDWIEINMTDPAVNDTPKFNDTKSKEIKLLE